MPWVVAPDRKDLVFVPGVAQPMRCGSAERARLIAVAPRLLSALEQAVTSMQDSGYPNSHVAVREARAAIAEATGEKP